MEGLANFYICCACQMFVSASNKLMRAFLTAVPQNGNNEIISATVLSI